MRSFLGVNALLSNTPALDGVAVEPPALPPPTPLPAVSAAAAVVAAPAVSSIPCPSAFGSPSAVPAAATTVVLRLRSGLRSITGTS